MNMNKPYRITCILLMNASRQKGPKKATSMAKEGLLCRGGAILYSGGSNEPPDFPPPPKKIIYIKYIFLLV